MREKIIGNEDFTTTKWAGGETTQLAIYPEDSTFSEKNFLWRISSATFTSTESKFSDFTGYQRYILPLEGKLSLQHEGLYTRELDRYEAEYFDGAWTTFSRNTINCRDYNFIIKSGIPARMQILGEGDEYSAKGSVILSVFSVGNVDIELCNHGEKRAINGFSLYVLETGEEETIRIISASSPVIITEFAVK